MALIQIANALVQGPTGTARFERRAIGRNPDVTDFRFTGSRAVINLSVHYQATAHTAPERDIERWIETHTRPAHSFTERCRVGIVLRNDAHTGDLFEPTRQIKIRPTFNLMRSRDSSRFAIDRPAKTNAYCRDFVCAKQLRKSGLDLVTNSLRAQRKVHREFPAFRDLARTISDYELQFRPANFDTKEHRNLRCLYNYRPHPGPLPQERETPWRA